MQEGKALAKSFAVQFMAMLLGTMTDTDGARGGSRRPERLRARRCGFGSTPARMGGCFWGSGVAPSPRLTLSGVGGQ